MISDTLTDLITLEHLGRAILLVSTPFEDVARSSNCYLRKRLNDVLQIGLIPTRCRMSIRAWSGIFPSTQTSKQVMIAKGQPHGPQKAQILVICGFLVYRMLPSISIHL